MSDEPKISAENQPATPAPEAPVATGPAKEIADRAAIKPGVVVRVHQKIKEVTPEGKERERIQVFEGTVIAKKGKDAQSATITVRKIASGVGVERIYPLLLPTIAKIEEVKRYRVRRAKLYFTRTAKKALKEKK